MQSAGGPLGAISRTWSSLAAKKPVARLVAGGFFLLLFCLGCLIYRDYGIAYDEQAQRTIGAVTVKYVAGLFAPGLLSQGQGSLPPLHEFFDRVYGVGFEAPAVILDLLLKIKDSRDVYMFRHLLNFFFYFGGVVAMFALAARRFGDWRLGLLAAVLLVLTPRFFAEGFYNSKDIVFMAAFTVAMYTAISFVLAPSFRNAILHAAATAFAIDIRIMGLLLVIGTAGAIGMRLLRRDFQVRSTLPSLGVYLLLASAFTVAGWPYLWSDPAENFVAAFAFMSHYPWPGSVLYLGEVFPATQLPWHYPLVWIAITTPILYLVLFVFGLADTCIRVFRSKLMLWKNDEELQDLIFAVMFFVPIAAVVLMHSVLYNGWRHLYFIYPMFLMLAVKGWLMVWNAGAHRFYKPAVAALLAFSLVNTVAWMFSNHPLQNVYFNALAGRDIRHNFEFDYWGLGNRVALERILKSDPAPLIHVSANPYSALKHSFMMLTPEERARLKYSDEPGPHSYYLTNYMAAPEDAGPGPLLFQMKSGSEVMISVFRRDK